jgi:hypothetical protein
MPGVKIGKKTNSSFQVGNHQSILFLRMKIGVIRRLLSRGFLPERVIFKFRSAIQHFKPKSLNMNWSSEVSRSELLFSWINRYSVLASKYIVFLLKILQSPYLFYRLFRLSVSSSGKNSLQPKGGERGIFEWKTQGMKNSGIDIS